MGLLLYKNPQPEIKIQPFGNGYTKLNSNELKPSPFFFDKHRLTI